MLTDNQFTERPSRLPLGQRPAHEHLGFAGPEAPSQEPNVVSSVQKQPQTVHPGASESYPSETVLTKRSSGPPSAPQAVVCQLLLWVIPSQLLPSSVPVSSLKSA